MAGSRSKFAEVVHAAACKGKAVAGATSFPTKHARPSEEVIILTPPLAPPATEESAYLQLESSTLGTSASVPTSKLPTVAPIRLEPAPASLGSNLPGLRASSS